MNLNSLFNVPGSRKSRKRICRGNGSGTGRTGGRGEKGQKSRSGVAIKSGGEQTSLIKKLPKRGFNCSKSVRYTTINLTDIEVLIEQGRVDAASVIDKNQLVSSGYIKNLDIPVKLLGGIDKVKFKASVHFDSYSKSARDVVEKAGGSVL